MRIWQKIMLTVVSLTLCGCAGLMDVPKTIWGSSTRVLEEARSNALVKTYDKGYWDCFRAVLDVVQKRRYVVFQKDEVRGFMVIMGIPGSVNTTEVGVFFVELNDHQTRIELSSLSTNAKRLLAKGLFHGMDVAFGLAASDQEEGFSAAEFKSPQTPEALVKAIEDDGYSVPSKDDAIDSLNAFLENDKFYDDWLLKYRDIALPKEALDILKLKDPQSGKDSLSVDHIKHLNRILLEKAYPSVCPQMIQTKPTADADTPQK